MGCCANEGVFVLLFISMIFICVVGYNKKTRETILQTRTTTRAPTRSCERSALWAVAGFVARSGMSGLSCSLVIRHQACAAVLAEDLRVGLHGAALLAHGVADLHGQLGGGGVDVVAPGRGAQAFGDVGGESDGVGEHDENPADNAVCESQGHHPDHDCSGAGGVLVADAAIDVEVHGEIVDPVGCGIHEPEVNQADAPTDIQNRDVNCELNHLDHPD